MSWDKFIDYIQAELDKLNVSQLEKLHEDIEKKVDEMQ